MRRLRIILWVLVAVAAAGLIALMLREPAEQGSGDAFGVASLGGPFTLTGADGQPFSSRELAGKPHAIFFGFTHCPDVCPTTLARLARLRKQVGQGDDAFEILFVSVDPERDRPEDVGKYATLFDTPIVGLTGSPAQIEQMKSRYGIHSEKVPDDSGGYSVDHTALVLLFDGKGDFVATISPEEPDSMALDKLKRIAGA